MSFRRAVVSAAGPLLWLSLFSSLALAHPEGAPPRAFRNIVPALAHPPPGPAVSTLGDLERARGHVVIGITIQTDGSVSNPVVRQSGGAAFDQAALETVRTWSFVPAETPASPSGSRRARCFTSTRRRPKRATPPPKPASPTPPPPKAGPPSPATTPPPAAPSGTPDAGAPSETTPALEVDVRGRLELASTERPTTR